MLEAYSQPCNAFTSAGLRGEGQGPPRFGQRDLGEPSAHGTPRGRADYVCFLWKPGGHVGRWKRVVWETGGAEALEYEPQRSLHPELWRIIENPPLAQGVQACGEKEGVV